MPKNKVDEKDIKHQNNELENATITPEAVVSKFEYYKQKAKKQLGDVTNTVVTKAKETKKKIAELREQRLQKQEQRLEEVKRNISKLEPDVESSNKELVEQLERLNETLESQTDVLDNLNDQIETQVQANETFVKATDANIAKMIGHVALNVTRPVAQTGKRFSQELAEEGIYYQKPGAVGLLAARIHPLVGFAVEKAVESVDWTDIRQNVKSKISEYLEKRKEQREKTRQYILSETLDEENETPEQPEEQVETSEEFGAEEQPEETKTETVQSVLPPSVQNVITKQQKPEETKAQKELVPEQTPEVQTPEITRTQASVEQTTLLTKLQTTAESILDSIVGKTKTQQESKSIYERLDSIIDHLNNIRTSLTEKQTSKIKPETKPEEQNAAKQIQQLNAQIEQAQIQIQAITKLPQQVQPPQPTQVQPVTQATYASAQVQLSPDIQQQLTDNLSVISTNLIGLSDKFDQLRKQMSTGFTSVTLAISNSYTQALTGFREKLIEAVNESPILKSMVSTFNIMSNIFGGLGEFFLGKLSSPYATYLPRRGNIQEKQYTVLSMIYCVLEEIGHLVARIVSGMEAIWHVNIPIPPTKPLALTTKTIPKAKVIAKWLKSRKSKTAQTIADVLENLTTRFEQVAKSEESLGVRLFTEFVNPITDRIEQTVLKKEQAEKTVAGKLNKFIQEIDKSVKVQGETIAEQLDKKYQQKEKSTKTISKIISDTIQKPLTEIFKFKEDKLTKTLSEVSSTVDKQQEVIRNVTKNIKESNQHYREKSIQLLESISKKTNQITKIQQEEYRKHKLQDIRAKLAEKFKKAKRKPSVIASWLWQGVKSLFSMGGGLLKWLAISFIPLLVKNFFKYGWNLVKNIVTAPFKIISTSASLLKEGASKLLSASGKIIKIFASGISKVVSSALGILSHPIKWIKQGAAKVWKFIISPLKEARATTAVSGLTRGLATAGQAVTGWGKGVVEAEGLIGKLARLIGGPLKLASKAVGGAATLGGRGIAKVAGGAARLTGKAGKFIAAPSLISAPIMAWSGYRSITHEELTEEWEKKLSKSGILKRIFLGWWDPAKTLVTFYRTVKESIQTRKEELEMEKKGLLRKVDESQTFMDRVIRSSLDIMIKIGDISKSMYEKFKFMGKGLSEQFTKLIDKIKDITEPVRKIFKVIIDKMKDVARAIKKALLFLAASPFIILFKILSPITKIPIVGKGASVALNTLAKVLPNGVEQVVRRHVSYLQPNAEETRKATEQPKPETEMQAKTSRALAQSARHLKTTAQKSMQQMQQTVNTVAATIVNAPSVANVTQTGGSTVVHRESSPFHADI